MNLEFKIKNVEFKWWAIFIVLLLSILYFLFSGTPALAQVNSCDAGQTACPSGCTLGVSCTSCWSPPTCTITGQTASTCGSCACPSGQVVCGSACQAPAATQGQACDAGSGAGSGMINQCGVCTASSPRYASRQYTSPGTAEDGHINVVGNVVTGGSITLGGVARTSWPVESPDLWTVAAGGAIYYSGGSVGVGTTAPAERLEVRDDTAGAARLRIADTAQNPELQFKYNTGDNDHWAFYVDRGDANKLKLWGVGATGNNRLTIDTAGNVGVGTTTPSVRLDVTGDIRASGISQANQFCFSDGACLLTEDGWPQSQWITAATNIYYDLGNVGIGTTTPLNRLHVVTAAVGDGIRLSGADNPRLRVIDTTNSAEAYVQAVDDAGQIGTLSNHPLRLVTNNTTRATLDTSGNFSLTGNVTLSTAGATVDGVNLDNAVLTSGTYANPAWLTSLLWSKLIGYPAACPVGQFVTAVGGTLTCAVPAAGGVTGSGTNTRLPKFTGATTLGDSILTESGGTISVGGGITATGCFGPTFKQGSGSAVTGNRGGYGASVCPAGMHICATEEILNSVQCGAIIPASGSYWVLEGPPGYTAAANDCRGLTSAAVGDLGTYWDFAQGDGGVGWMTPCSSTLEFSCCS